MKRYKMGLVLILVLFVMGCSNKEVHETVEVFSIEHLSETPNSEGLYVKNGYKKVNVITYYEKSNNLQKTEVFLLEDYYDIAGKYDHSIMVQSEFEKNLITQLEKSNEDKKEMSEAITILAPSLEEGQHGESTYLSEAETLKVKAHIMELMKNLTEKN